MIYTIGPSPIDVNRIWIGTDDGVIQTTGNGGLTWTDVTPTQIGSYWKLFMIDAGRFSAQTAYAAVNTLRIDDMRPHIYRTHDAGKTWTEIVGGMEGAGAVNAVREDPKKRGLLYASTENGVYVSFDDGEQLAVAAAESAGLVGARSDREGRRRRGGDARARLLDSRRHHAAATDRRQDGRARRRAVQAGGRLARALEHQHRHAVAQGRADDAQSAGGNGDRLLPEVRADRSDHARDSHAGRPIGSPVLERRSVAARADCRDTSTVPLYWYRPPQRLSADAGVHRFHWDLRYQPLGDGGAGRGGLSIQAIPDNTAPSHGDTAGHAREHTRSSSP